MTMRDHDSNLRSVVSGFIISAKISALGTGPLAPAKWKVVSNGATQLVDSTQYQWTYLVIGNVASGI